MWTSMDLAKVLATSTSKRKWFFRTDSGDMPLQDMMLGPQGLMPWLIEGCKARFRKAGFGDPLFKFDTKLSEMEADIILWERSMMNRPEMVWMALVLNAEIDNMMKTLVLPNKLYYPGASMGEVQVPARAVVFYTAFHSERVRRMLDMPKMHKTGRKIEIELDSIQIAQEARKRGVAKTSAPSL